MKFNPRTGEIEEEPSEKGETWGRFTAWVVMAVAVIVYIWLKR